VICPNCSTENLSGAKFCMECGTHFVSGCPNCGFVNLAGAKFCSECGTVLAASAANGSAAVPRPTVPQAESNAERRLVSILFADLVGFTPFAEERDSEDVRETLTRYFDLAAQVIERYGGTVEKFIGDAVMAVWGAPVAREDDAERAVRAGLELVDAVTSLGSGIQARAGVLTGEAAVTLGATNQGMVAGDIVNTASRLQSVAPPGAVLVGEATHRAASAAIAFEEAGDQVLKGKHAPVTAWRALRVVAERGGRNRTETLEAPFVGRQEELRLLKDLFHSTGREQRLRVVSVIGPAGIGKSRLAWEFSKYIDGLIETVYWHRGRSPAYGEGITFWALGEMVRERCELLEMDDEATTRSKVKGTVAHWVMDEDEREWVERSLLTLLGVEGGMAADQLFGAWRTFFERIAASGPVALVFEDMHFADAGLLDFVDHLLDFSRGLPIYVVTLARPDLIERRPEWGAGKRNFVSMYLEPLSESDMRQLLAGLVPGLPEAGAASIVARADGIPLYAVETVRTLVAEGKLVEEDGVYVPKGDLTTLAVPETLTALIASRLDTLDETDRHIVHDAAVLGQSFTLEALASVVGVPESELEPRMASFVRRELMRREMDPRSPERGQYAFVQALIREVAYNTLSKKDRKKLHLAAARYFESLGNDEIAGALASHYLAAQANAAEGEESDALAAQARIALRAAATRASSLGSFDQAVTFFEQALAITTDPIDEFDILLQAGEAARIAGRLDQSEGLLRRAVQVARELGDRERTARATSQLGNVLIQEFRNDEALELLGPATTEFADLEESALVELRLYLGRAHLNNGDFHTALEILEGVLETAERRGLLRTVAMGLIARGNGLWGLGRRREAYGAAGAAKELAEEHGMTDLRLQVMGNLANADTEKDVRSAIDHWLEAISLARKLGHRGLVISGVGNYGYSAFLGGDWDEGLAEMDILLAEEISARDRLIMLNNALIIRVSRGESIDDGLAEMGRLGRDMSGPWHLFLADPGGNAAMARGDFKKAHDEFVSIAESDPGQGPEYFYRAARAALWDRNSEEAARLTTLFEDSGGYGIVVNARHATLRAGIAALDGRPAEAVALYRDALRDWRSTHAVWDEAMTGIDMAMLLDPADPEVVDVVSSTQTILERLGARPYLERLEAAIATGARATHGEARPATAREEVALAE
jgi:class 3 adenylate cyclase/tetratricopeptide (TPR) repeat protein